MSIHESLHHIKVFICALCCILLSSCCLPLSPLAACYIPPSDSSVMRRVRKANISPDDAYVILCNHVLEENRKRPHGFNPWGAPRPRFSIIKGKYFFHDSDVNKLACEYDGWEFNQYTGKYRYINSNYVRYYFDCNDLTREYYPITKKIPRLISLYERINGDLTKQEKEAIEEVVKLYLKVWDECEERYCK